MKLILTIISLLLLSDGMCAQESPTIRPVDAISGYVEYSNIRFRDEKAMLDHWASQFRLSSDNVIYIFVYSGRRACAGEAVARAVRAKSYLVRKRGIRASRIIWRDGGFRENLSVELWLRTRKEKAPDIVPTVDPTDVKFIEDCRKVGSRRGEL